jgi:hypothetical protein
LEIFFTPETQLCHSAELESREDSHLSYFLQKFLLLLVLLLLLLHFTVVGVVVDYCRPLLVLMMVRRRTRSHHPHPTYCNKEQSSSCGIPN